MNAFLYFCYYFGLTLLIILSGILVNISFSFIASTKPDTNMWFRRL